MSNENVIDDKIIASLRSLRPDRWNRWIEAGRRGEEQGRKLALLIKASKEIPYYERLSHFVQVCLDKSGISTDQASRVLGIDLRENCLAMDEASISTLEAAHLLQLNREYVRKALLLACISIEDVPFDEPIRSGLVRLPSSGKLLEDSAEKQEGVMHPKSSYASIRSESDLDRLSELRAYRERNASPEDREKLKQCTQRLDAWESSAM